MSILLNLLKRRCKCKTIFHRLLSLDARLGPKKVLNYYQINHLKKAFASNRYPNKTTKKHLASQLDITERKVNDWFRNQRTWLAKKGTPEDDPNGKLQITAYLSIYLCIYLCIYLSIYLSKDMYISISIAISIYTREFCNRSTVVLFSFLPRPFCSRILFLCFHLFLVSVLFTGPSLLVVNIYRKFLTPSSSSLLICLAANS